jgi:hypothetical protein
MKKIFFGLLLLAGSSATLSSCKDADRDPAPPVKSMPVIMPVLTPGKDFINFDSVRAYSPGRRERQVFEFTINPTGQRDIKLEAVEMYKSYMRPGASGPVFGPRVLVGTYTTFPATFRYTFPELLSGLQRYNGETLNPVQPVNPTALNNLIAVGDAVVFTFEYIAEGNQRIVLTPLNSVGAPIPGTFTNTAHTATAVIRRLPTM